MKNEDKVNGGAGNGIKDYLVGEECGLMPGLIGESSSAYKPFTHSSYLAHFSCFRCF